MAELLACLKNKLESRHVRRHNPLSQNGNIYEKYLLEPSNIFDVSVMMADSTDQSALSLSALTISACSSPDLSSPSDLLISSATTPSSVFHTSPSQSNPALTITNKPSKKSTRPFEFGQRHLSETANPFEFNAWDHVTPPASFLSWAESQYALQRSSPVSNFDAILFNTEPARWWNRFYANNTANFFKDRKWLRQEFPVLQAATTLGAGSKRVLEIGAGAGNTAFPIVRANENPELRLFACDFSRRAVELIRGSPAFDELVMQAEIWDLSSPGELPIGVDESSIDVVLLIFTFSALSPRQWAQAVRNVWRVLKPGGEVCFRDYGRGDLAQVRFRKGRWMEENFYVRGDGTRVYFFDEDELRQIWGGGGGEKRGSGAGSDEIETKIQDKENSEQGEIMEEREDDKVSSQEKPDMPSFEILDLGVDRRLTVNRKEQLMMYRCWMQGRFRKPFLQNPENLAKAQGKDLSSQNDSQSNLITNASC